MLRLSIFMDGITQLISTGVKETEISYQLQYSKHNLKKCIEMYPAREVKKVYICVCVFICVYICIYICAYTCACMYISIYIYVCVCICNMYIRMPMDVCVVLMYTYL